VVVSELHFIVCDGNPDVLLVAPTLMAVIAMGFYNPHGSDTFLLYYTPITALNHFDFSFLFAITHGMCVVSPAGIEPAEDCIAYIICVGDAGQN
jgi:hypothetical protein